MKRPGLRRACSSALLGAMMGVMPAPALASQAWPGLLPEPPSPPLAVPGSPAPMLLHALIEHSRLPLPVSNGRLGGAGGERWRELAAASAHVVMGEQHGNAGIARVAQAMWSDLATAGWRHAAFEIDPFVTAALRRELQRGGPAGWARFLAQRGGARSVPFVGWTDEVELAAAVPQLWGLDQVFIGSAGWLLQDLLALPDNGLGHTARAAVHSFAAEAAQAADWLGRVDPVRLQRAAADSRAASPAHSLLLALQESARLYAPFSGGDGEPTTANARREQAMKLLLAEQLRRASAQGSRPPRVFLKVGAYHGMRGATPTGVQGLGGFVTEMAAARSEAVLTVMVLCGPGSKAAAHVGPPQDCDGALQEGGDWQFLRPYLDEKQATMFDLRSWRLRLRRLQGLPFEVQRVVGSYDLLVFVPAAAASTTLGPP